jgi:hypothetical protein
MSQQEFELIARLSKSNELGITAGGLVRFNNMDNAEAAPVNK